MKINKEQIQKLYDFTRQHFVEYYDLQTELVDHLANAIEQQWNKNPKISFDEALQLEFKKFGVFGFQDVVSERRKALSKKYNLLIWSYFKDFFKLPQVLITLIVLTIYFKIISAIPYKSTCLFWFLLLLYSFIIYKAIRSRQKLKKQFLITQKKWLYEEIILNFGSISIFFQLPTMFFNLIHHFGEIEKNSSTFYLIMNIVIVVVILFSYIILFKIPSKAEEYLKQTYPEYKLVN